MDSIFDYLDWRGDLTFAQDGLNEVDSLAFSALAYVEFDGIVPRETDALPLPLWKAVKLVDAQNRGPSPIDDYPFFKELPAMLRKAAASKRFCDVTLRGYVNQVDFDRATQFSAIVFSLSDDLHFIAFRGTDDTIAGWKEDFQMSFLDEVPAQRQAVAYLNEASLNLSGRFYLGGHSKGGNLAVYAGIHLPEEERDRVTAIYSNDAPGFQMSVVNSEGYCSMLGKIHTFLPKSSVVGMLLEHGEEYKVVGSSGAGIFQHNPFSWEVRGPRFVYEEELTRTSRDFDSALRSWLGRLSIEQRIQFVDALFEIIQGAGAQTVSELSKEKLGAIDAMIRTWIHMKPSTRALLRKTIAAFFSESQKVLRHSIGAELGALFAKKAPEKPENPPV